MTELIDSIKLDKSIPVPLYFQLKKQVLALIEESKILEGEMLPAEGELCNVLNVSRPTIRQAFSELVSEGYLSRYKGKGTFVSKPKVEERFFSKLETFNKEMISKGLTPKTTVMVLEKVSGPQEANEKLKIPLDAPLIHLGRLRLANNIPLVYVDTFLSFDQYSKLMKVDYSVNSLYDSLEKLCNIRIDRAQREIEAINAPARDAALLQIAKNKALSLVKTIAFSNSSSLPVEFSIARYRGDMNKFTVDIVR